MTTENSNPEEFQERKVEFLKKLKELLEDYIAVINYHDGPYSENPNCFSIVTDAHVRTNWEEASILEELNEDSIDSCIEELTQG